jgi:hypothetical protein
MNNFKILYKGFPHKNTSPLPSYLTTLNTNLHFTPYLAVAEFYAQNGFLATYKCPFNYISHPHPDNSGPPFNFNPIDYQTILTPSQINKLILLNTTIGKLLPGTSLIGPNGNVLFKDINPPIIFNYPTPYNMSHFKVN